MDPTNLSTDPWAASLAYGGLGPSDRSWRLLRSVVHTKLFDEQESTCAIASMSSRRTRSRVRRRAVVLVMFSVGRSGLGAARRPLWPPSFASFPDFLR